ncbi:MAG: DOPA 4,5-dioxygenase family protein [Alphaproteobacteria bacterium]|nr:DOPA 4,5-dioxygenase family protein [Alphaproteobacteria bacterium]|tara:strand:- start:226 stop:576 length:351 start_codon:yes stop_codon:yes gene_type:complete
MNKSTPNTTSYHAHIYFEKQAKKVAANLRRRINQEFDVKIGKWHNKPIGPHPNSMYQVTFDASIFSDIILWLSANRNNLNILIHPQSGDNLKDHTDLAIWLGKSLELKLDSFTKKV